VGWRHCKQLVSNRNHGLVLLSLRFAHDQVGEAIDLLSSEVRVALLEMITVYVFLLEVVSSISEAVISVDLLVNLGCLFVVSGFEESTCGLL